MKSWRIYGRQWITGGLHESSPGKISKFRRRTKSLEIFRKGLRKFLTDSNLLSVLLFDRTWSFCYNRRMEKWDLRIFTLVEGPDDGKTRVLCNTLEEIPSLRGTSLSEEDLPQRLVSVKVHRINVGRCSSGEGVFMYKSNRIKIFTLNFSFFTLNCKINIS